MYDVSIRHERDRSGYDAMSYPEIDGTSYVAGLCEAGAEAFYVAGLCEAGAEAASPQLSGFRGHRPQLQEEIVSTIVP